MGAAVLSGGLSTLLGVLPLVVASSPVTRTVFVAFVAMVTLGVGHGLIFLPVLLSIIGPESTPLLGQGSTSSIDVESVEQETNEVEPEETKQRRSQ
jgi:Patched family